MGDNAELLDTQKRRAFVLRRRTAGATYRQIAQDAIDRFGADNLPLSWDCRYAASDVRRELDKVRAINRELAQSEFDLQLERLDIILAAIWPEVEDGDLGAIDRALKLLKQRSDLLGLDAPERLNVSGDVTFSLDDWRARREERRKQAESVIDPAELPGAE